MKVRGEDAQNCILNHSFSFSFHMFFRRTNLSLVETQRKHSCQNCERELIKSIIIVNYMFVYYDYCDMRDAIIMMH
jgi:hypothetical protein